MTWSFNFAGKPAEVKQQVTAECSRLVLMYGGHPEADDVTMVRDRVLALIECMVLDDELDGVVVIGNGSHASVTGGIVSASASFQVQRAVIANY